MRAEGAVRFSDLGRQNVNAEHEDAWPVRRHLHAAVRIVHEEWIVDGGRAREGFDGASHVAGEVCDGDEPLIAVRAEAGELLVRDESREATVPVHRGDEHRDVRSDLIMERRHVCLRMAVVMITVEGRRRIGRIGSLNKVLCPGHADVHLVLVRASRALQL